MIGKKGIFFTIDSVFSLVIIFAFLTFVMFNFLYTPNVDFQDVNRALLAGDILDVLKDNDFLSEAINDSSMEEIRSYLNITLGDNLCAEVNLYNSSSPTVIINTTTKTGCSLGGDVATARRLFLLSDDIYIARSRVW